MLTGKVTRADFISEQLFEDPRTGRDLGEKLKSGEPIDERELLQMLHNADLMEAQNLITADEHRELTVGLKAEVAKNWLLNDGRRLEEGRWEYRGQAVDNIEDAQLLAYADVKHVEDRGFKLTPSQLQKAALDIAKGAYQLWIGDDIDTLLDPDANLLKKTWSGVSLASNFIPGAAVGKLGAKVSGSFVFQGAKRLGKLFQARGVKHLGNIPQVPNNPALRQQTLEEARQALQKHLKMKELPDNHEIMRELRKSHLREQSRGGLAQATEVYVTKDGQKVIFRTKIDKASKSYDNTVWTSVVEKSRNGKVVLKSHENYKHLNGIDELMKYEEKIPGAEKALGEMVKKGRHDRKQQVIIKQPRKPGEIEAFEQRIEQRFREFIFEGEVQ